MKRLRLFVWASLSISVLLLLIYAPPDHGPAVQPGVVQSVAKNGVQSVAQTPALAHAGRAAREAHVQVLQVLQVKPRVRREGDAGDPDARLWVTKAPTRSAVPAPRAVLPSTVPAPSAAPLAVTQTLAAPAPPFRVLGRYAEAGREGVFLVGSQGNVLLAHAGDKLQDEYQVESISGNVMVLSYLPLDQKQAIDIGIAR